MESCYQHADDAGVLAVVTEPTKCVSACGTNHVSSAVRLESSYRVRTIGHSGAVVTPECPVCLHAGMSHGLLFPTAAPATAC